MSKGTDTHVILVGAGLAGALFACFLGRRGYRVDVYERRPDPRASGFIGGRSINLAISTRGINALAKVGLAEKVLAGAVPMRGRMMHSKEGHLTFQPYSKDRSDAINSVSRGGLNLTLLEAADAHENVTLHFGHCCLDVDLDRAAVSFRRAETGETIEATADVVIGADGAFSVVRGRMQKVDRFSYSQTYLEHGYRELSIPPVEGGAFDGFAMEPHALHIWPRGGYMMIALPNQDKTFTCTLFWPHAGPHGFDQLDSGESIVRYFQEQFGDAVPLMPKIVEDYQRNPVGSLVTVRCDPWHYRDKVVLIGDAAHAIVPFYGQGMNAGFEDCVELDQCIQLHGRDWGRVLEAYTKRRKVNGDAIADMALDNFIEMRDKVKSRAFLLKKRIEKGLHRVFPRWFLPLYNMVTFSTIPYAEARRRAARQARTLHISALAGGVLVLIVIVKLVS